MWQHLLLPRPVRRSVASFHALDGGCPLVDPRSPLFPLLLAGLADLCPGPALLLGTLDAICVLFLVNLLRQLAAPWLPDFLAQYRRTVLLLERRPELIGTVLTAHLAHTVVQACQRPHHQPLACLAGANRASQATRL